MRHLFRTPAGFKLLQEISFIEERFPIRAEAFDQIASLCVREIRFL